MLHIVSHSDCYSKGVSSPAAHNTMHSTCERTAQGSTVNGQHLLATANGTYLRQLRVIQIEMRYIRPGFLGFFKIISRTLIPGARQCEEAGRETEAGRKDFVHTSLNFCKRKRDGNTHLQRWGTSPAPLKSRPQRLETVQAFDSFSPFQTHTSLPGPAAGAWAVQWPCCSYQWRENDRHCWPKPSQCGNACGSNQDTPEHDA